MSNALTGAGNVVAVEAGIDWITWIDRPGSENSEAMRFGRELVRQQERKGSKVIPLRIEGYSGLQAEGCAYGSRKDTNYLRLSGSLAESHWRALCSLTGNPSRLDVQTTWLLNSSDKRLGTRCLSARSTTQSRPQGRPLKRTCSRDSLGLWLGTVGTRTGRRYLRIYDKGIEARTHPAGFRWRFELEAKQSLARGLWNELSTCSDHTKWCRDVLERTVLACGASLPTRSNQKLPLLPPEEQRELASVEATKRWLAASVKPSVERLLRVVPVDEILEILDRKSVV